MHMTIVKSRHINSPSAPRSNLLKRSVYFRSISSLLSFVILEFSTKRFQLFLFSGQKNFSSKLQVFHNFCLSVYPNFSAIVVHAPSTVSHCCAIYRVRESPVSLASTGKWIKFRYKIFHLFYRRFISCMCGFFRLFDFSTHTNCFWQGSTSLLYLKLMTGSSTCVNTFLLFFPHFTCESCRPWRVHERDVCWRSSRMRRRRIIAVLSATQMHRRWVMRVSRKFEEFFNMLNFFLFLWRISTWMDAADDFVTEIDVIQWVSVSYGIFICLECSGECWNRKLHFHWIKISNLISFWLTGKHRGLGVHLSFVRSVTMDKWKDMELQKMKVGGNRKAREFFEDEEESEFDEFFGAVVLFVMWLSCNRNFDKYRFQIGTQCRYIIATIPSRRHSTGIGY